MQLIDGILKNLGLGKSGVTVNYSALKARSKYQKAAKNSDQIPFLNFYDESNILCEGGMLRLLEADGLDPDNYSESRLYRRIDEFAEFIKINITQEIILYQHILRRPCDEPKRDTFANPVCAEVDDEWRHYLYNTGWKDRVVYGLYAPFSLDKKVNQKDVYKRKALLLDSLAKKFESQLSSFGFKTIKNTEGDNSPSLAMLKSLTSFDEDKKTAVPGFSSLSTLLGSNTFYYKNTVFQQTNSSGNTYFGKVISITGFPRTTYPSMFEELRGLPYRYNITQIYSPVISSIAIERYDIEMKRRINMEDAATSLIDEIGDARESLATGAISMGRPAFFMSVVVEDLEDLEDAIMDALTRLSRAGVFANVLDWWSLNLGYYSMIPGNTHLTVAPENINNKNFASMAAPINRTYKEGKHHWGKPLTTVKTLAGTLAPFGLHGTDGGDIGNFVATGGTGSGKTTLMNMLMSQGSRNNMQCFVADKDKGAKIPILAMGGKYYEIRQGEPFVNPLMLPMNEENKGFLKHFLAVLAGECTAKDNEIINTIINMLDQYPKEERTLSTLAPFFKSYGSSDNSLYLRLKRWFGDGEFAWLFDHNIEFDFKAKVSGIDITYALDREEITAATMFVTFHVFESMLDGTPTMLLIDEGWQALDNETTQYKIKDNDKTIRKKNGLLGLLTQDPEDIITSPIYASIKNQSYTFITFPTEDASEAHLKLGFRQEDLDLLRTLPDESHYFVYRQGRKTTVAQLDLSICPTALAALTCNKKKLNIAEPIIEQGDENWFETYKKHPIAR